MSNLTNIYKLRLDIVNSICNSVPEVFLDDKDTRILEVAVTNGGVFVNLDNINIKSSITAPNGANEIIDILTKRDNIIIFNIDDKYKAITGTYAISFLLQRETEKVVIGDIKYIVK